MTSFCGSKVRQRASLFLGAIILTTLSGCGGTPTVPVTGMVTYKGQPVQGGSLMFSPISTGKDQTPGQPAIGVINTDGTYTLARSAGTGVQVGRHRLTYSPPAQELTEEQRTNPRYIAPPPAYMGLATKESEVEVTPNTITLDIELVKHKVAIQ